MLNFAYLSIFHLISFLAPRSCLSASCVFVCFRVFCSLSELRCIVCSSLYRRNSPGFGLEKLEILVLDEADRLLELGFFDEVRNIK